MTTTQKVEYKAPATYSRAGFFLSMIGGSIIIIQGLVAIFFSSIYYAILTSSLGVGISVVFLGIMLVILGIIVYSSAYALTRAPDRHTSLQGHRSSSFPCWPCSSAEATSSGRYWV